MTGAMVLADDDWRALAGQKVGVISNPTGILPDLNHIVDTMHASGKVNMVAVFGPEHGFRGRRRPADPRATTSIRAPGSWCTTRTARTRTSWSSLYTKSGVETVVFDIQDVGARFYTYIWTMYEAMLAAVRTGARFVVLDRPNPVGGYARGPMLKPGYTSGVGKEEIIQQHGMTVGELARLFNAEYLPLDAGWRAAEGAPGHPGEELEARPAVRRHRPDLGDAEPEHADPGHRAALPGAVPVRGDQHVRGPRYDAAVRADRSAVRRLQVGGGAADEERSRASRSGRRTSRRASARTRTCSAAASRCRSPIRTRSRRSPRRPT